VWLWRRQVAKAVREVFTRTEGVVDIDDSSIADAPRALLIVDRRKASMLGVSQQEIVTTLRAGLAGEVGGDQPVDGLALGRHGAALGIRDHLGGLGEAGDVVRAQAVAAEAQRGDERTVHDQVGVAANGRREVRVAAQRQAEMALVDRIIDRLSLGAEHHLVDDVLIILALNFLQ